MSFHRYVLQVITETEGFHVFVIIQYISTNYIEEPLILTVLSRSACLVTAVATLMLFDLFQLVVMESHPLLHTFLLVQNQRTKQNHFIFFLFWGRRDGEEIKTYEKEKTTIYILRVNAFK